MVINKLPPSYDVATSSQPGSSTGGYLQPGIGFQPLNRATATGSDEVYRDPYLQQSSPPSSRDQMLSQMQPLEPHPTPAVYHYQDPKTGHIIASLLPPNHPESICLKAGEHIEQTSFGVVGLVSAFLWFPLGLGVCFLDRKVKCRRCDQTLYRAPSINLQPGLDLIKARIHPKTTPTTPTVS